MNNIALKRKSGHNQSIMELLKQERHLRILDRLHQDGKVVAAHLSTTLGVSEDTIRRDLQELSAEQKLQRVHGGALPRSHIMPWTDRQGEATEAKLSIARAAARLVHDGQVIFVGGGTTVLRAAECFPLDLRATVITNSPPVASTLAKHRHLEVIIIGGRLHGQSLVTLGAKAIEAIRAVRADVCLLGVCGIHPDIGLTAEDIEEAAVMSAMIAGSADVVIVASADKLGTALPYLVSPLSEITYLVTERTARDAEVAQFRGKVSLIEA